MKCKKSIKSLICLFAILFSFSVSAYNSVNQGTKVFNHTKKIQLTTHSNAGLTAEDLLFEELENETETEDFINESFLLLPFLSFSLSLTSDHFIFINKDNILKSSQPPIYLSIGIFRI